MGFMKIKKDMENFDKFMSFMGSKDFSKQLNFLLGLWFLRKSDLVDKHLLNYLSKQVSARDAVDLDMTCFYTFGGGVSDIIYRAEDMRLKSKFKEEEENKLLRGFRIYEDEEGGED